MSSASSSFALLPATFAMVQYVTSFSLSSSELFPVQERDIVFNHLYGNLSGGAASRIRASTENR